MSIYKNKYGKKINSHIVVLIDTHKDTSPCPNCGEIMEYYDRFNYAYLECPKCSYQEFIGDIMEIFSSEE